MEQFPSLDRYKKYLQEQSEKYQLYLNNKRSQFNAILSAKQKSYLAEELEDIISTADKLKQSAIERYNKSIDKIQTIEDEETRIRKQRMAKADLEMAFETAKKIIDNFLKP